MEKMYRRRPRTSEKNKLPEKSTDSIPLPNEKEYTPARPESEIRQPPSSILDLVRKYIHFEEIIIIGLIFILLDEGIDDEFLLIILIYILLT